MTGALRIATDMDAIAALAAHPGFAAIDRHPVTGGFGRAYYPAVDAGIEQDRRFAVFAGDAPLLYAPAIVSGGRLSHHGMPLHLVVGADTPTTLAHRAVEAAFAHLDTLFAEAPAGALIASRATSPLDAVGEACLARGLAPSLRLVATVDLTAGDAARRAALRKSFRALVNWGMRAITLSYVNSATPDRADFDTYQAFHHKVAGRVTRPQASWDAMFAWIASGGGELALGRLGDGALVSATLVVDGTDVAYYASGVYDRERFDKPLAHWPLWDAMARAAARGMAVFELGEIPLPGTATDKEIAIGYFKRGFAMALDTSLTWSGTAVRR